MVYCLSIGVQVVNYSSCSKTSVAMQCNLTVDTSDACTQVPIPSHPLPISSPRISQPSCSESEHSEMEDMADSSFATCDESETS